MDWKKTPVLLLILLVAACAGSTPTPTLPPTETPAPPQTEPPGAYAPGYLDPLEPTDVLLQLDYEPTFSRPEALYTFGRVPAFTLLADGTVIMLDERGEGRQRVLAARLSPEETRAFLADIWTLGFPQLEDHLTFCREAGDGQQECIADAAFTILRARSPEGGLQEVKIYANFSDHPEILEGIQSRLMNFEHASSELYQPEMAALFLRPVADLTGTESQPWPLDADFLTSLRNAFALRGDAAVVLEGDALRTFLDGVPGNYGNYLFDLDGEGYQAYLVPWLPGFDDNAELQAEFPLPPPPQSEVETERLTECPIPSPAGRTARAVRVASLQFGTLWLQDLGQEPVQLVEVDGVEDVRLTPDGTAVVLVRRTPGGEIEILGAEPGDEPTRTLLSAGEISGEIELLSFSEDGAWLAFTHRVDEYNVELWGISLDGSGARALVTVEDLALALTDEPPDPLGVEPTAVQWIPGTHTLAYDVQPVYDGLWIYVQDEVRTVDADSGQHDVLLPAGRGGQLLFSPDGARMAIATPERLRIATASGESIRDADVDYQAIGFGEFYFFPRLAWTPDSSELILAQPADDAANQDTTVVVWRVPADGSPAVRLSEFTGFGPSIAFSPNLEWVAYWRAEPQSNFRGLHLARVDGTVDLLYDAGHLLEFLSWGPDSLHFAYVFGEGQGGRTPQLGHLCQDPVRLSQDVFPLGLTWLDASRFLFRREESDFVELHLGTTHGANAILIALETPARYDVVSIPAADGPGR